MIETIDATMVNWARATFALTAMYHWLFVPLTLGLSFLCAFYETIYVRTQNPEWKRLTKFWMRLFAINFVVGIATGIILEFEFGTHWANFSWMVGDIFGAPLAIEGIVAFFLEAAFIAVMLFGWNRVSRGVHLFSTWMVAVGSSLSALWILVANGWMQAPVGMVFNPDAARFEMQNLWEIISSPVALSHFAHATSSGFVLASLFVIAISSYYLLKKRHVVFARRSIAVATVFGLFSALFVAMSGDEHAVIAAKKQPMKLAAMESLYDGTEQAGLIVAGIPRLGAKPGDEQDPFTWKIEIPGMLSLLANRSLDSFVPGINDLLQGNEQQGILGVEDKIRRGRIAVASLAEYKQARSEQDDTAAAAALHEFDLHRDYLGYGHLESSDQAVPPVWITFFAFRIMVGLGVFFILFFLAYLFLQARGQLEARPFVLKIGVASVFLAYVASQAGWVVTEVGRYPWAIQGLLPVHIATSNLDAATVAVSFFLFLGLFTALSIAAVKIITRQISIGPEGE